MRRRGCRADLRVARQRLADLHPQVAAMPTGPVRYATRGTGADVLAIHGIPGGFDAGLRLARRLRPDGYRVIAPSRFGYLGTPLPATRSVAAQADAHIGLLGALGVQRVTVLAASAGGASALQLAIRHPDRVCALVSVSSVAPGPYRPPLPRPAARVLSGSDVLMWAACRFFPGTITALMGVAKDLSLRVEDSAIIAQELGSLLAASQRVQGALFDLFVSNADINQGYRFDQITAPTLVIHAKGQPSYKGIPGGDAAAAAMARLIPAVRMLSIDHGGHLLLGDHPESSAIGHLLADMEAQRDPQPATFAGRPRARLGWEEQPP